MYFFLKEPGVNKETIIYLIYHLKNEGKNFKYSTGQKIHPDQWDGKNRMPLNRRGEQGLVNKHVSIILNKYSSFLESQIKDAEIKGHQLTREDLKQAFNLKFKNKGKTESLNFTDIVQEFINAKNKSGGQSDSWNQKYSNLKKKLAYFEEDRNKKITFSEINSDWLDEYSGYLRTISRKPFKPHNDNTLHRNINFFFTFLIWAQGKYHNLSLDNLKNPVKKYQADDVHLTREEVERLETIQLENKSLERVRDLFLIGVYSGQRFSDYSVFERADVQGDMIIKRAEKTENDSFIPLHKKLKVLLDKYEWELPKITGQKFNPRIQKVCEIAKINEEFKETIYRGNKKEVVYNPKFKMVASHTARRTFITLSAEQQMPDHIIMKITGIRDIKTLHKYKKTSQHSVMEAMNKYWG